MVTIFISFAEEDDGIVDELAGHLSRYQITTWRYTRNSILTQPYTAQIPAALAQAKLVIVFVSRDSLKSHHVTKEIEQAYQRGLPILPILHDVTSLELRESQPSWDMMFGTNVYASTAYGELSILAERIKQSLDVILPNPIEPRKRPTLSWASDGSEIEIDALGEIIFPTIEIERFILQDNQFFISANKGLGKTLILRHKRAQLQKLYDLESRNTQRAAVHLVPEGRPYLDMMESSLPSLPKGHVTMLSSLRECKRLWAFALRLSVISHFPDVLQEVESSDLGQLSGEHCDLLTQPRVRPTLLFRTLLSLKIRNLNRILDNFEPQLSYLFNKIHSGAYLFVDRVEMAISHLPQPAWINIQAGLIEAAWDVMNANNHVKVYATIREEAFVNYESDFKTNMHSATLTLRYSIEQLRGMLNRLCEVYEGLPGFNSFIGMKKVFNADCHISEDAFRYLHRYTVGRPRDLVIICHELSKYRENLSEEMYRDVVGNVSSKIIVKTIFSEMGVFLDSLNDAEERHRFFSLIPYNILTRADVEAICCQFNGLSDVEFSDFDNCQAELRHPFCELFNCGLIGIVANTDGNPSFQLFKQPHDVMTTGDCCLPASEYYLIHPSLQFLIHQHRLKGYQPFRFIPIGHRYEWKRWYLPLVQLQKAIHNISETELKQHCLNEVKRIISTNDRGHETPNNLQELLNILEDRGYDEVHCWIQELLHSLDISS